jgi:hypothetical protein
MARLPSIRRHNWRVKPACSEGGDTGCQTILCGFLFNAEAERGALGLGIGQGEECCITIEPIADARIPAGDDIRVSRIHPHLTGVQLRCGHRFAAVNLLWHWTTAPMVCPVCRAPYVLNGGLGNGTSREHAVPVCSSVENWPFRYWRLLRGIITEQTRESQRVLERENQAAIVDVVMNDMFDNTAPAPGFFLLLSFICPGLPSAHHSIRLHHMITTNVVTGENSLRFSVPRASTRYISRLINIADTATRGMRQPAHMTATVLVGIGRTSDGIAIMIPVANFANRMLPIVPDHNGVVLGDTDAMTDEHTLADATPCVPRTVVSISSTDSRSEIKFVFYRDGIISNNTLVAVTVSLDACPLLTAVAQNVV